MSAEMPPRIWAWPDTDQKTWGGWTTLAGDVGGSEFVRADIADGLLAEAAEIIRTERECLAESHSVNGVLRLDPADEGDRIAGEAIAAMDDWLARAAIARAKEA